MVNNYSAKMTVINDTDLTLTLQDMGKWGRNALSSRSIDCYWEPGPPPVIRPDEKVTFAQRSVVRVPSTVDHQQWGFAGWATYIGDCRIFKLDWSFPSGPDDFADWNEFPFSAGYAWNYAYDPDTWEEYRPVWTTNVYRQPG